MFLQLLGPPRLMAPAAGVEVSSGIIAGMCTEEIMGISLMQNRDMAAHIFLCLRGKKGNGECVLVIIRD